MTTKTALATAPPASMIGGMTLVRKTVTLDAKVVEAATRFGDGNLSAYVNEALMKRVRLDHLRELVEEDIRRRGPLDEEYAKEFRASMKAVEDAPFPGRTGE